MATLHAKSVYAGTGALWAVVEAYGFWFLIAGGSAIAAACAWLLVRAFHTSWPWGLGCLLFLPALLPFAIVERRRLRRPLLLLASGPPNR